MEVAIHVDRFTVAIAASGTTALYVRDPKIPDAQGNPTAVLVWQGTAADFKNFAKAVEGLVSFL